MRKTKIICTVGPACDSEETLTAMCKAGMNVARLNFSHGTYEEHQRRIDTIKKVRTDLNLPIAIMLDTKGPEYRIGSFHDKKVELKEGDIFIFTSEDIIGDETRVSVSYKELPKEMNIGDTILLNNGLLEFKVLETNGTEIKCEVMCGGTLSDKKSMAFPGKHIEQIYLSDKDKEDILFGIKNDVDFVACSFVSVKQDVVDVLDFLKENGGTNISLIAKIENQSGCDNIEGICEVCSGIMVARGDMGVEIPLERLPAIQKSLITKCRLLGKRAITATEMLESMINNPRPTRAEASDVANAVYDGTSAIMLSGETAAGSYPVQAVQTMAKIAENTEENINYKKRYYNNEFFIKNETDAISHATCAVSMDIEAKAIVACTISGMTARLVSRFRGPAPIIGLTTDEKTWRKLALSWGVVPKMCERLDSTDVLFYMAKKIAAEALGLVKGDKLVITGGIINGQSGNTNLIKVESV